MWRKPHGLCNKENYKEKLPRLVFKVHAVTLVTVRCNLGSLGVHESTEFLHDSRCRANCANGIRFARRAGRINLLAAGRCYCAARRSRCARRTGSYAAGRCRCLFVIFWNLSVESFLAFFGKCDDGHSILGKDVARADIDAVAVNSRPCSSGDYRMCRSRRSREA